MQFDAYSIFHGCVRQNFLNRIGHSPQILAFWRHINVNDALDLVMIHLGGGLKRSNLANGVEQGGVKLILRADGNVADIAKRTNLFLVLLTGGRYSIPDFDPPSSWARSCRWK